MKKKTIAKKTTLQGSDDAKAKQGVEVQVPFWERYIIPPEQPSWVIKPYELATLAARLSTPKRHLTPADAIKAATDLMNAAGDSGATIDESAQMKGFEADMEQKTLQSPKLEDLVKHITQQERPGRAMRYFRKFVASHGFDENERDRQMNLARASKFNRWAIEALRLAYDDWKEGRALGSGKEWQRVMMSIGNVHEGIMASDDPLFEAKAVDIIGLYLKPPANAAVFCVDEKTAIQALECLAEFSLPPGRAERHGVEYHRQGILSLCAALETRTGAMLGTFRRQTSFEFVALLKEIVAYQPAGRSIQIVADNLSAHKTYGVAEFLQSHPLVKLHYTPTYSSWLDQIDLWFSKIERDLIARGIFTSVAALRCKLMRCKLMRHIGHYDKAPKAFKWLWRDPSK